MYPPARKCQYSLEPECGRLCSHDQSTHLMTRLALIESSIMEKLEAETVMGLRELMEVLPWEPCAVTMAVGSLVRQQVIHCAEYGEYVFLEYCKPQ